MPTVVTHVVVGAALAQVGPPSVPRGRLTFALVVLSVLPDLDVVAFHFNVPYSHWLGHRGLSHSLLFAVLVAAAVARFEFRQVRRHSRDWWVLLGLCTMAMASHGLLDALTDGGLGVAFFLPFTRDRYFFPIHPLVVSPIGLQNFIRGPALVVLAREIVFVWAPVLGVVALLRRHLGRRETAGARAAFPPSL